MPTPPGIVRLWPVRMIEGFVSALAEIIAGTEVPKRAAMPDNVSPLTTTYVDAGVGASAEVEAFVDTTGAVAPAGITSGWLSRMREGLETPLICRSEEHKA